MSRRALAAALALLSALPVTARATTRVTRERVVMDVAYVAALDVVEDPDVAFGATVLRYTGYRDSVRRGGRVDVTTDFLVVCLAYETATALEGGCARTSPGRPVTDGLVVPQGATLKVRVPVQGRRGGWVEADLRLAATTSLPLGRPASAWPQEHERRVLGVGVPVGATVIAGTIVWRPCAVHGTFRTDRGLSSTLTARPEVPIPTSVLRHDYSGVTVLADLDDLTAEAAAATRGAVAGSRP